MNKKLSTTGLIRLPKPKESFDCTYGTVSIPWYGVEKRVNVIFERDEQDLEPNEKQIEAFYQLLSIKDSFFPNLETKLFEYYNQSRTESDWDEKTINELLPKIGSQLHLQKFISEPTILVSYFEEETWGNYIGLLVECSWDVDHGIGVKIKNNKIIEISNQDIVL